MPGLKRRLLISLVCGFLVAAALIAVVDLFDPPEIITNVLLWPVAACVYLVGPGPNIGPPEKHMHEGTPVHVLAAMVGYLLSWIFYSILVFFFVWSRRGAAEQSLRGKSQ
jgi:membrane associated rhomboid family serine protease